MKTTGEYPNRNLSQKFQFETSDVDIDSTIFIDVSCATPEL